MSYVIQVGRHGVPTELAAKIGGVAIYPEGETDTAGKKAIPTAIQVGTPSALLTALKKTKVKETWFITTRNQEENQVLTSFAALPAYPTDPTEVIDVAECPYEEALVRQLLYPYNQATGHTIQYVGPEAPCYRSGGSLLLQEFPRLALPTEETQLFGIPVRSYKTQEITGFTPFNLDGRPLLFQHAGAGPTLYLNYTPLDPQHGPYLLAESIRAFFCLHTENQRLETYNQNLRKQFTNQFADAIPGMARRVQADAELISEADSSRIDQLVAQIRDLINEQSRILTRYTRIRAQGTDPAVLQDQAGRIANLRWVRHCAVTDLQIVVLTAPFWFPYGEFVLNIGSYLVTMGLEKTEEFPVQVTRIQGKVDGWDHPHFRNGVPVREETKERVLRAYQSIQMGSAVETVLRELTYYEPDEAGVTVERFRIDPHGAR